MAGVDISSREVDDLSTPAIVVNPRSARRASCQKRLT
jgi:hypothetical protein